MKRKDKFTKDEIIELYCDNRSRCSYCIQGLDTCNLRCKDNMKAWFEQEIETKPRIATINTEEDMVKARKEYDNFCQKKLCFECKYSGSVDGCFTQFLLEAVEE